MAPPFGPDWRWGMSVLMLLLSTPAARCQAGHSSAHGGDQQGVHTVHLVFSHHLDVGLDLLPGKIVADCVGFATKIVQRYFDEHIPRAIRCVAVRGCGLGLGKSSPPPRHDTAIKPVQIHPCGVATSTRSQFRSLPAHSFCALPRRPGPPLCACSPQHRRRAETWTRQH